MPDRITVRVVTVTVDPGAGFRTEEIQIACTMLDPETMSATDIGGSIRSVGMWSCSSTT